MASLSIKPSADRVLIEVSPAEERTTSGIIIPDTSKEKTSMGKIVAIGIGNKTIKVGDNVLYDKHDGTEIIFEGKKYLILRESDILAII